MDNSSPQENVNLGFVIIISCVATIGGFLFGFDSGVINGRLLIQIAWAPVLTWLQCCWVARQVHFLLVG